MVTTEAFVLETYLAASAPKSLTTSAWLSTREQVLDLVRQLAPATEAEAKNLLGALTRYLARMCPGDEADVSALTSDGIDRFVALERAAGAKDSTLGQVSSSAAASCSRGQVRPDEAPPPSRVAARVRSGP